MSGRALLYGASGYTGREVARALVGADLVLAGRDEERVRAVAEPLGLPWRVFDLAEEDRLVRALADIDVVLHAAGPFDVTARPMLEACLLTGTHYLDLNGEWPGFLEAMAYDAAARAAKVMLMPGVGLTIVATDCLLALAKQRWPDTDRFRLGISKAQVVTRGSVASVARLLSPEVLIRRNGELVAAPAGRLTHAFDFGEGLSECAAMNWADLVTGAFTTGVPNIEVYSELGWSQRASYVASGLAMRVTGASAWRSIGGALAAAWPEGPDEAARRDAGFVMVVEALDPWRRARRLRLRTLDGYTVSVLTAAEAVRRVLAGEGTAGFQTPARVFGPEFVLEVGGAMLEAPAEQMGGAAA
jgi:short subunit dehydrogenase-like uncharacterized protein